MDEEKKTLMDHTQKKNSRTGVDRRRNGDNDNLVRANDVFFSVHALAITIFTIYQSFIYKVCTSNHWISREFSLDVIYEPLYLLFFFFFQ